MTEEPQTYVVRLTVHVLSDGRTMVGIMGQAFSGPRRVDIRLTSARETADRILRPPGVNHAVWEAWCGLSDLVDEQHAVWAQKRARD